MFVVWAREWFIERLRREGSEGSLYSLGGVPWQWRILPQEAQSPLRRSSPSIGQGTAVGTEFLCDEGSVRFRNVLRYR